MPQFVDNQVLTLTVQGRKNLCVSVRDVMVWIFFLFTMVKKLRILAVLQFAANASLLTANYFWGLNDIVKSVFLY